MTWLQANWQMIFNFALQAIALLFGGGSLVALLPKLKTATDAGLDWLNAKAQEQHNKRLASVLSHLSMLVKAKVDEWESTVIDDLKIKAAGGSLTAADLAAEYKKLAPVFVAEVKSMASAQGIWQAALYLFNGDAPTLSDWVTTTKASHVADLPPSGLQTATAAVPAALEVGAVVAATALSKAGTTVVSTSAAPATTAAPAVPPVAAS